MAKVRLNSTFNQFSGSIDKFVFKQTEHGTVVTPKPNKPETWSVKQYAHRERMKYGASRFYREQKRDPVRFAHYQARAKELKIPVSAFVMGGFMKHGAKFAVLEAPPQPPAPESDGRDGGDAE